MDHGSSQPSLRTECDRAERDLRSSGGVEEAIHIVYFLLAAATNGRWKKIILKWEIWTFT
jgi:predicted cupin superfamily sugar epimerase